ncbi:MAG: hypothetical protein HONBIEJF_00214 [Fimbriimonadaceae bacterium]|nr:hypothetical protein [Fimbriimonadaceae bacterium]
MTRRPWIALVSSVLVAAPVGVLALDMPVKALQQAAGKEKREPLTDEKKSELKQSLNAKKAKVDALKAKAVEVTMNMGDLAKGGKVLDDDSIELMKKMVQELGEIKEQLQKISQEIESINGWIEGQNEALPIMAYDINDLKRVRDGNYLQFQYRDSNEDKDVTGSNFNRTQHSFNVRRARISTTYTVDPRTSMRFSFDIATGTTQNVAQLRDAYLVYDIEPSVEKIGIQLAAGQMPMPLGYELERSSSEREFPERTFYNNTMFAGERSRGVMVRYGLSNNAFVHAGVWNALTFNDPEQSALAPGPGGKLAMHGGIRYYTAKWDLGVSHFRGDRPGYKVAGNNAVSPELMRNFTYVDGSYIGLLVPQLTLRGEMMWGKDRLPNATPGNNRTATDMRGYQVALAWKFNDRNQLNFRYEQFDPNKDMNGDALRGWGATYLYYINPGARLMVSFERLTNPARRPQEYNVWTTRLQFRF